jgi:succinate dehydrogenase/fumarate reductase cytochrome b subunit
MITNPILPEPVTGSSGNAGVTFFQKALPAAIIFGLIVGVIIFFFTLITGAIAWISSGGDKQALEGAKAKVTNAIIGLVVLFAVFAIIQLIEVFFGISILTLDIGKLVIQ